MALSYSNKIKSLAPDNTADSHKLNLCKHQNTQMTSCVFAGESVENCWSSVAALKSSCVSLKILSFSFEMF